MYLNKYNTIIILSNIRYNNIEYNMNYFTETNTELFLGNFIMHANQWVGLLEPGGGGGVANKKTLKIFIIFNNKS